MASAPVRPPRLAPFPEPALVMKKLMLGVFCARIDCGASTTSSATVPAKINLYISRFSFCFEGQRCYPDYAHYADGAKKSLKCANLRSLYDLRLKNLRR